MGTVAARVLIRLLFGLAALGLAAACLGTTPTADPGSTGEVMITVRFQQPPPGQPISIGGYAVLAHLASGNGEAVIDEELVPGVGTRRSLPAGDYELGVAVRPASDAIEIDQFGNQQRDLGPVTATCAATLRITPADHLSVLVTVVGGDACSIGPVE